MRLEAVRGRYSMTLTTATQFGKEQIATFHHNGRARLAPMPQRVTLNLRHTGPSPNLNLEQSIRHDLGTIAQPSFRLSILPVCSVDYDVENGLLSEVT
ncbi:hypothetical protein BH24CHL4_BH24CHL4_08670 [soil metagenome]